MPRHGRTTTPYKFCKFVRPSGEELPLRVSAPWRPGARGPEVLMYCEGVFKVGRLRTPFHPFCPFNIVFSHKMYSNSTMCTSPAGMEGIWTRNKENLRGKA